MKRDDMPMWEDPNESPYVRDLLQAGRRGDAGYDVERGLAKHLAMISGVSTAPAAAAAAVGAAVAKRGVPASFGGWFGWMAAPLVAAGIAGVLWVFSGPRAAETPAPKAPAVAPAAASRATDVTPHRVEASETLAQDDAVEERRAQRPSARPHATPRTAARASRGPSEAVPFGAAAGPTRTGQASSDVADLETPTETVAVNPYQHTRAGKDEPRQAAQRESPAVPRADEEAELRDPAAPSPPAASEAATSRGERKKGSPSLPVADESQLEREMQMLAVTQRVLASDPARALRLSQQGEREFSGSMLSAERRQLGLLALVKLGRLDEARRAGRPFLARYPNAPWSERLRRALVAGKVE